MNLQQQLPFFDRIAEPGMDFYDTTPGQAIHANGAADIRGNRAIHRQFFRNRTGSGLYQGEFIGSGNLDDIIIGNDIDLGSR